jgi:hypothetical protein
MDGVRRKATPLLIYVGPMACEARSFDDKLAQAFLNPKTLNPKS